MRYTKFSQGQCWKDSKNIFENLINKLNKYIILDYYGNKVLTET